MLPLHRSREGCPRPCCPRQGLSRGGTGQSRECPGAGQSSPCPPGCMAIPLSHKSNHTVCAPLADTPPQMPMAVMYPAWPTLPARRYRIFHI